MFDLDLTTLFDYLGTFAFAISGIRLAAAKKYDIFGTLVMGFVTAVGGGTIRDICIGLVPFWMVHPSYIIITIFAMVFTFACRRWLKSFNTTFFVFDALGLALFTVVGLEKAASVGFPFWVNILMGCITGAGGGMLRDVLLNDEPMIFRKDIYAVASILGGAIYYLLSLTVCPLPVIQFVVLFAVIAIRFVAVRFNINLPSINMDGDNQDPNFLHWKFLERNKR